jgi:hypothetical protein
MNTRSKAVLQWAVPVLVVTSLVAVAQGIAGQATRSAVPRRLVGTWMKTMTPAAWGKYQGRGAPGTWAIVISRMGDTRIYWPPGRPDSSMLLSRMRATASASAVVFSGTVDPGYCLNGGSYKWSVSARTLAFKVVKDGCVLRRILLTVGRWKRS